MEGDVLKYCPRHWDKIGQSYDIRKDFIVEKWSIEFLILEGEVREAVLTRKSCKSIRRNQNVYDFSRLLKAVQLMSLSRFDHCRLRRFIVLKKEYLQNALDYNLGYKKCGLQELKFTRYVPDVLEDEVLLIIDVATDYERDDIIPNSPSEYMIDYVVELNQTET